MKIEGYFANMKTANETVSKLKGSGFQKTYLDSNDHYDEGRNVKTNLAGTETAVSLSGLVLESDSHGVSMGKSPLDAASPMVSGYGAFEEVADVNCKVVVEAGEFETEKARKIIADAGGSLENPNFIKPKLKDEAEIKLKNQINQIRHDLQ